MTCSPGSILAAVTCALSVANNATSFAAGTQQASPSEDSSYDLLVGNYRMRKPAGMPRRARIVRYGRQLGNDSA
jgi:hypothetical protein